MIKVTVQKNLIGLEDLLVGTGTEDQNRGPSGNDPVAITKINGSNLPYDATYSMAQKFDALQAQMDTLPVVVDEGGNLLTGLINTSAVSLDLAGRIWRKEIDATTAGIYYGTELMFEYNPATGNIYIPGGTDYVAADAAVTAAYEADDDALEALITALDTATASIHDLDVGTSANNLVQLDGSAKLPAVDGSQLTGLDSGVPVGVIIDVPYSTPDTGWLECDGSEVSRTTYAALYAKIGDDYGSGDDSTTFNLPDYRGEFRRTWDNGRGIDTGRTLGSFQDEEFKSHLHDDGDLATNTAGNHTHTYAGGTGGGNNNPGNWGGTGANTGAAGNHSHTISGNTGSTGGDETRPRNVSVMTQIKVV